MYTTFCCANHVDGFERKAHFIGTNQEDYIPITSLSGFNRINIFIGSNNSGKSRFLRNLFSNSKEGFFYVDPEINWLSTHDDSYSKRKDAFKILMNHLDNDFLHPAIEQKEINGATQKLSGEVWNYLSGAIKTDKRNPVKFSGDNIYIPLMRGLNPLMDSGNGYIYKDLYNERVIKQYFSESGRSVSENNIFTGQTIHKILKEKLLGSHIEREKVKEYEAFLSSNLFEGKEITLIPRIDSDTVWVKIEQDEYEIHNFGDGIQSLIIFTFPIFMNSDKECLFFFEEPEINMHPGMQRVFLKVLQNNMFPKHQYFLTTHSNHLVDLAFDYNNISIYMFKKLKEEDNMRFTMEKAEAGNIELLKELGVNNSSVFLANCIIWVEGVSDRLIIREYLKREFKERMKEKSSSIIYVENMHYSFCEYGGSAIANFTSKDNCEDPEMIPLKRISNKPMIIADYDRGNKTEHTNRIGSLGKNYFFLEGVKEIENTLHEEILVRIIADYEKVKIEDLNFTGEFTQNIYKNINLGKFIDERLGSNKKRKCSYAKGNTINEKKHVFAQKACKYLNDSTIPYEKAMSKSAIELASKIIDFIEEANEEIINI